MAKRSRRARKAQTAKAVATVQKTKEQVIPEASVSAEAETDALSQEMSRKAISFTQDYYYVYNDVRILAVVTVLMVVLMVGLSFVI